MRSLRDALRRRTGGPRRNGRRLRARADARAGARLLHPHDLRVRRAAREPELDHHGRWPLRLPHRGDRRPSDARDRLRRRDRAAADRDGGGGCRRARGSRHRRVPRARGRRATERRRALARRAPTGGRRGRDRLRGAFAQGPAHAVTTARRGCDGRRRAETATLRTPGRADETLAHDEIVSRLSP